jgi:hypothetical protein
VIGGYDKEGQETPLSLRASMFPEASDSSSLASDTFALIAEGFLNPLITTTIFEPGTNGNVRCKATTFRPSTRDTTVDDGGDAPIEP